MLPGESAIVRISHPGVEAVVWKKITHPLDVMGVAKPSQTSLSNELMILPDEVIVDPLLGMRTFIAIMISNL